MTNASPMGKATIATYADDFARKEIVELARSAGYEVADVITQRQLIKSEYGVGVGKAEELRDLVSQNGSKTIIVDEHVTSAQAHKLATVTRTEIVDRERLILNIFASRAATTEAKLQVQLAELQYEFPRARDAVRYSVKGERAGFSGMGETSVDIKFRALKKRMSDIKEKLKKAQSARRLQRRERRKLGLPFVSLAGYTSSGKTTLFNRLASESKEESPSLFTTLTTTTRAVGLGEDGDRRVMLSDTVGFISRLPTYMVESFKSTLDELRDADLVLLLIDASEDVRTIGTKLGSCLDTMRQLDVDARKILLVLNKIDLMGRVDESAQATLYRGLPLVRISAVRGDGLRQLRNRIVEKTSAVSEEGERA